MPSLLKKLMNRATRPRTHPAQAEFDLLESPPPSPPTDIDRLAAQRLERLQTQGHTATLDHEQVRDFLSDPQAARPPAPAKLTKEGKSDKLRRFAVGDPPPRTRHVRSSDKGQKSLESLIGSISAIEALQADGVKGHLSNKVLGHCLILLEAQRDEVKDAMVYMEGGRYPALKTLEQVYDRILLGLKGLEAMTPTDAKAELNTLDQLVDEAPDYLIDTFIIELVIHHAEVLDTALASEVRKIHDEAVAQPGDLKTFRRAAEGIVAYACAIPSEDLDDDLGKEAYKTIGKLVKQLRVDSGEQALAQANKAEVTAKPSTADDNLQALAASALESRFGTGPMPSPALTPQPSRAPIRAPSPVSSDSSLDSVSLYEYRGQILTASAMDLVLRQEALAVADSSGQYAGAVSWDDLRRAWIPKNVVKLKDTDLAAGEMPSTNPADYEVKMEDDFGNKIGWTDRYEIYYKEENPKFEV